MRDQTRVVYGEPASLGIGPRGRSRGSRHFFLSSPPSPAFPASGRGIASVSLFSYFSPPFPLPFFFFSFFSPFPPFHHFPLEALPLGRGRAGLTPRLSPAPAALWREGTPSPPGHKRRRLEERDRRRRPQVRGRHGTNSLTNPPAAAVRPARAPAPAPSGPLPPLLPPQSARSWSRASRRRAQRKMRW